MDTKVQKKVFYNKHISHAPIRSSGQPSSRNQKSVSKFHFLGHILRCWSWERPREEIKCPCLFPLCASQWNSTQTRFHCRGEAPSCWLSNLNCPCSGDIAAVKQHTQPSGTHPSHDIKSPKACMGTDYRKGFSTELKYGLNNHTVL
jgi:hypothetical protein